MIYEPREDSYMLEKWVKMLADGKVLDVGTGSGIQALAALENADSVMAVDINEEALDKLKQKKEVEGLDKLEIKRSDLFRALHEKFDVIIFNPPYLPQDAELEDASIYGGTQGYEVLVKFLEEAKRYLNPEGIVLFLFSSLTKKKKVDETLEKNGYTWSVLDEKSMDFESLYIYKAWI